MPAGAFFGGLCSTMKRMHRRGLVERVEAEEVGLLVLVAGAADGVIA